MCVACWLDQIMKSSDHCKSPWTFASILAEPLPVLGMGVRHWPGATQSKKKQGCAIWCRWCYLFWVKISVEILGIGDASHSCMVTSLFLQDAMCSSVRAGSSKHLS